MRHWKYLVSLAAFTWPAMAGADNAGPYLGAGYGAYQFEDRDIDQSDSFWKAYVGAMINSALGLELSYVDFSRANDQGASFDADGYGAAILLSLPATENLALYAKGGVYFWNAQSRFAGLRANDDGEDPFYGAGLQFKLNEPLDLRLEYERYEIVEVDIDSANVSLQFSF